MAYGNGGWAPYVPVAERRKKAEREMAKLRKKGHPVAPVRVEGRTLATTFWGKAWCDNLKSYRDYENRLPRGRTYVRNGSVVDLQIAPLQVKAMVSGSLIYMVTVSIKAVPKAMWQSLCRDCAGGIDSLVELLQGRFSVAVMERLCRQDHGLFPKPMDIRFSCSCPDSASMCKHVAAVLYGIGSRLDENPELLFRLRSVDEKDLVANLDAAVPLAKTAPAAGRLLEVDDAAALFGLDMVGEESSVPSGSNVPPASTSTAKTLLPASWNAESEKQVIKRYKVAQTVAATERIQPPPAIAEAEFAKPGTGFMKSKASAQSAPPKSAIELTSDGFVKWWK